MLDSSVFLKTTTQTQWSSWISFQMGSGSLNPVMGLGGIIKAPDVIFTVGVGQWSSSRHAYWPLFVLANPKGWFIKAGYRSLELPVSSLGFFPTEDADRAANPSCRRLKKELNQHHSTSAACSISFYCYSQLHALNLSYLTCISGADCPRRRHIFERVTRFFSGKS